MKSDGERESAGLRVKNPREPNKRREAAKRMNEITKQESVIENE